jgi:hypothetical protein
MPTTFEKLNLKDHKEIVILNAPESFEPEIASLDGVKVLRKIKAKMDVHFLLAFVLMQNEVDAIAAQVIEYAEGDAIVWFAYPKGTSKKYKCDFNRDTGWDVLRAAGWDTVRAVAIDEDWSGIRFRRIEYIKNSVRRPATKNALP